MTASSSPLVTAVIPTYRRPQLLRRAIYSALNQGYPHIQVCVYDNASGDETRSMVAQIAERDNRLRYFCHPRNVGSYNNFNHGLREVDTPYFVLLSDDDVFAPNFFERAVQGLERHPQAAFLSMPTMAVDLDINVVSGPTPILVEKTYGPGEGLLGMVDGTVPAKWSGILFRKQVRDVIGVIDTEAGPYADAGYVFHAAARFPFVVAPGMAAVYMVHGNTTSGTVKPIDGNWPGWWERMIAAVAQDQAVPSFAREQIRRIIYPDFRKIAVYQTLRALGESRPEQAAQSARGLALCGYVGVSRLLSALVWAYNHLWLLRYVLTVMNRRQKLATNERINELQKQFGHQVEFIKHLGQAAEAKHV